MNRKDQIVAVHAQFINQVVTLGQQPGQDEAFEQLLKMADGNGWINLRQIFLQGE